MLKRTTYILILILLFSALNLHANILQQANQHITDGNPEKAANLLKDNYERFQKNVQANYLLGHAYFLMKRFHWSQKYLKTARDIDSTFKGPLPLIFQINYEMRDYKSAYSIAGDVISNGEDDENFYYKWGHLYEIEKDKDRAIEKYELALNKNKDFIPAMMKLGSIYYSKKKYAKAQKYFRKAHELEPENDVYKQYFEATVVAYNSKKGKELIDAKKYEEAIPVYKELYDMDPRNYEVVVQLANLYYLRGSYEEAISFLLKHERIKENPLELYQLLGMSYGRQKEYEKALQYYKEAIRINPKDATIYYKIAKVYHIQESYDNAEKNYKKSLEYKPKNKDAHYDFGLMLIKRWKYAEALVEMKEAKSQGKKDGKIDKYIKDLKLLVLVNEGDGFYDKEDYKKAVDRYEDALKIEELPKIYVNLGNSYIKLEKYSDAVSQFKKAIEKDKDLIPAYFSMGIAYKKMGKTKQAEDIYLKAQNRLKGDPEINYKIGLAFEESKDFDTAAEYYKKALNSSMDKTEVKKAISRAYYRAGIKNYNNDKMEDARKYLRQSVQAFPQNEDADNLLLKVDAMLETGKINTLIEKADKYFNNRQFEKALSLYEKIIEIDPKLISIKVKIGETYYRMEKYKMAELVINDVLDIERDNIDAIIILAYIYYNRNAKRKMNNLIEQAEDLARDNEQENYQLYNILGLMYESKKETDIAIKNYQKSLNLNPNQDDAYISIGNIYFYDKQYLKAMKQYKAVLDKYPDNVVAMYNLGIIYLKKRALDKAGNILLKCYEKIPSFEGIYFSLGRYYYYSKQYNEALKYMEQAVRMNPGEVVYVWGLANIYHRSADQIKSDRLRSKAKELYDLCINNVSDNHISLLARKAMLSLYPRQKLLYKNRFSFDPKYKPLLEGDNSYLYDHKMKKIKKVVTETEEVLWSIYEPAPPSAQLIADQYFMVGLENMQIKAFTKKKGKHLFTINKFYATWLKTSGDYLMAYDPDERLLGVFNKDKKLWSKTIEKIRSIEFTKDSLYYYNRKRLVVFDKETGKQLWEKRVKERIMLAATLGDYVFMNFARDKKSIIALYNSKGKLVWETQVVDYLAVTPTLYNEKIYCCLKNGKISTFLVDGTRSWKKYMDTKIVSQVVHDDKLFITSKDKIIYGLSLANGSVVWKYNFPDKADDPNFYMVYYR